MISSSRCVDNLAICRSVLKLQFVLANDWSQLVTSSSSGEKQQFWWSSY
jgi:hypothetical protein